MRLASALYWTGLIYSAGIASWGPQQYIWPLWGKIWSGISFQGLRQRSVKSSFCGCPLELLTLVSNSLGFHLSLAINMSPCWGETQSRIKFTAYKIWCPLYWFKYLSLIIYLSVYGLHTVGRVSAIGRGLFLGSFLVLIFPILGPKIPLTHLC